MNVTRIRKKRRGGRQEGTGDENLKRKRRKGTETIE